MSLALNFEGPLNNLSFGQVSYNLLREMYERGYDVAIWPTGQIDISAYEAPEDFENWIASAIKNRFKKLDDRPTVKLWHLNGSQSIVGHGKKVLYTFHETDQATDAELNVASVPDAVVFSHAESVRVFKEMRPDLNAYSVPIGFDKDLKVLNKNYLEGVTHFTLFGKLEARKNTERIIRTWIKLFGNDSKYRLSCFVDNVHLGEQNVESLRKQINGAAWNVSSIPFQPLNSQMNDAYCSSDIDLTGLSLAEGFNLPAFNITALGGHSIVLNHTGHKEWATKENCLLIEPEDKEPIYDNIFFREGDEFNQGNRYSISESKMEEAMKESLSLPKVNKEGLKLQEQFTYSKTLEGIIRLL